MDTWRRMQAELDALEAADLLRRPVEVESACGPVVTVGGRSVVCLCSNDYLGLASDEAVKSAAIEAVRRWGVGAGASRLVCGTTSLHVELERRLAEFKRVEAALVTPTGWTANHVAIHALARKGDLVLLDKLDHASIIDVAISSGAAVRTYAHRDVDRLTRLLDRHRASHSRCLIVTDSVFSMDGDVAPLRELVEIKERFDAQLLLDEAHATGVLGEGGRGAAELLGVEGGIDATVGTMSKALGAMGGFVGGPRALIETIRNTGRAFIYTTAPPAAICAAVLAALDVIRDQPDRRRRLLAMADELRAALKGSALPVGASQTQIIPVMIGRADLALRVSRRLLEKGFLVPAIRPPTVPRGASRLRVSLSAGHDVRDLRRFVEAVKDAFRAEAG